MRRTISVLPAWAYAITHLGKRIENRSWRVAHRGELLIHAGIGRDAIADRYVRAVARRMQIPAPPVFECGAIVARAELYDIVPIADAIDSDQEPWVRGPWLWLLRDVTPIEAAKASSTPATCASASYRRQASPPLAFDPPGNGCANFRA